MLWPSSEVTREAKKWELPFPSHAENESTGNLPQGHEPQLPKLTLVNRSSQAPRSYIQPKTISR